MSESTSLGQKQISEQDQDAAFSVLSEGGRQFGGHWVLGPREGTTALE